MDNEPAVGVGERLARGAIPQVGRAEGVALPGRAPLRRGADCGLLEKAAQCLPAWGRDPNTVGSKLLNVQE